MPEMEVVIEDVPLRVEVRGEGEPALVFLHYWGGSHRTWSAVAAALAAEAAALIERLQLGSYVLVGHSMGGKIAQLLAAQKPRGLAGLVLVAPAPPSPSRMPEEARHQQWHAYDSRETVLQAIAFLCARTPAPALVEQIVEDSLSAAPEARLAWPAVGMMEDITPQAASIAVPTLVLAGELDRLDPIEQHRREVIGRIPGATLVVIPGSGHLLPLEEPLQTARAIERFLATMFPCNKETD